MTDIETGRQVSGHRGNDDWKIWNGRAPRRAKGGAVHIERLTGHGRIFCSGQLVMETDYDLTLAPPSLPSVQSHPTIT